MKLLNLERNRKKLLKKAEVIQRNEVHNHKSDTSQVSLSKSDLKKLTKKNETFKQQYIFQEEYLLK